MSKADSLKALGQVTTIPNEYIVRVSSHSWL